MNKYYQREDVTLAWSYVHLAELDFRRGDFNSSDMNFLFTARLYGSVALEIGRKSPCTKEDLAESAVHCYVFAGRKDLALNFIDKITEGDQSMLRSELITEFKKSDERRYMLGKEVS